MTDVTEDIMDEQFDRAVTFIQGLKIATPVTDVPAIIAAADALADAALRCCSCWDGEHELPYDGHVAPCHIQDALAAYRKARGGA